MLFFSFFSFERERVLFSLVGTEKKTPLWKERDLERETRRDCLKYDVIVFFSFWITPSLSSPPLLIAFFPTKGTLKTTLTAKQKRQQEQFWCRKRRRRRRRKRPHTKTEHGTLLSLKREEKKGRDFKRVCFWNTAERRRRRRMIARALRREARKALSTTTRREALTVRLPPPFFVCNRIVVRISWHRIGNTKCRCRNRPRLPFFFRARLCARSPPVSLSVLRTRRERIFFRAHQRTNTNTNNRERLPPRRPRRTTPPTRKRTPNSNQASRGRKPVTTI